MTRLRTRGDDALPGDARAVAVVCLGVLLAAATVLSAPGSSSGPLRSSAVPRSSPGPSEETLVEVDGAAHGRRATPRERADEVHARAAEERAHPLDINQADASALQRLPGVGPVLAERIVHYREMHGAFQTPEDLLGVPGIGATRYAGLRPLVRTTDSP